MSRQRNKETPEEYELRLHREEAERIDERRNETITRGELLDCFDTIRYTLNQSGSVGADIYALLDAIESALE